MLQALVDWSLRQRVVILALALVLLLVGFHACRTARLDVFPEFSPPQVVIQTEAPGLSPLDVEQLVTTPLEQSIRGLPRLSTVRSQSLQGLSVITVLFEDGADIYRARQQVAERLTELSGQLPRGVKTPRLAPLTASTGRLLTLGFTSERLSPLELRDRVQWQLRPRLLGIPGVAQITIYGGAVRQFQIEVDPEALAARRLSLNEVVQAAREATGIRGAGFQEDANQRLTVRSEGQIHSVHELGQTVLTTASGTPVLLKDVAHLLEGAEPRFGDASINGVPGVTLVIFKQLDGDTLSITRALEAEMTRLAPELEREGIHYHPALFRQASFIEQAVGNVTSSLLLGALLVAAVLFVFLFNLRTACISLTAIPLSLLGAVVVLWLCGLSLNTLTLGGLAIAVGEVVDDAIIDVENIFRRLRENARREQPLPTLTVILQASLEVRSAVVHATFIVALVFLPIFFLSGLQGRLFAPLGYAYVLAVLVSLLTALTVTPALSLLLLPRAEGSLEPPWVPWMQRNYEHFLRWLDRAFAPLSVATLLLLGGAVVALLQCGGSFLPELRENHFVIHMRGLPGTSLVQSMRTGGQLSQQVRRIPGVQGICQQAGRAELGEDTWGVEYSELELDLHHLDATETEALERKLKASLSEVPGFSFEILPFLSERIKETLSGQTADLAITISGDDLDALDETAQEVAQLLSGVRGQANLRIEAQKGSPELVIRLRPSDAARYGLRNIAILETIQAAGQGVEAAQVHDRNRIVDVMVRLDPAVQRNPSALGDLWLDTPGSNGKPGRVQLKDVADLYLAEGRFLIAHEGGLRRQVVTCNVAGRDVTSFVAEVQQRLDQLSLRPGVHLTLSGEHEARATAQRELLQLSALSGAGITLLLWLAVGTVRRLLLVLINLPFALVGGVAAVYMNGGLLDVGALIGFVTLFGITVRNGLMMISHWQHLHEQDRMPWGAELVYRGARERLAPVLMTALVTGLGLLPIALGSGEAGREIEGPMALVILGGLLTSTALNLVLLPLLYLRHGEPPGNTHLRS